MPQIRLNCPKLKEYTDEYTQAQIKKKSRETPERCRRKIGSFSRTETEADKDLTTEKRHTGCPKPVDNSPKKEPSAPPDGAPNKEKPKPQHSNPDLLKQIAIKAKSLEGRWPGFNPFAWIQRNIKANPNAILHSLSRLAEDNGRVENPWAYANSVLKTEGQNYNEKETIKKHEETKAFFKDFVDNLKAVKKPP